MKYVSIGLSLMLGAWPFFALGDQATSTNFKIETGVIDVGGSEATSSGYNLRTSIGQPATGISSSSNFLLRGGFLNFPDITPPPATPPPPTPPPAVTLSGGGRAGIIPPPEIVKQCDFNNDSRCNIVDLSIMLFYYNQAGPRIARYDLSNSNRIDFPDVSVLMFYWTG